MVEVVGIEPTSKEPSSREYYVRSMSVRTNTIFDFYWINKQSLLLKSNNTWSLCGLYFGRSANVFTSFLLSVLAPQEPISLRLIKQPLRNRCRLTSDRLLKWPVDQPLHALNPSSSLSKPGHPRTSRLSLSDVVIPFKCLISVSYGQVYVLLYTKHIVSMY